MIRRFDLRRSLRTVLAALLLCPAGIWLVPATAHADAAGLRVSVGYADNLRANPASFPVPWQGAPNTQFVGSGGPWDAGAIRIDNTSGGPITINDVKVVLPNHQGGNQSFDLWGSHTIPNGGSLILTQTTQYNFDVSDFPFMPCGIAAAAGTNPPQITLSYSTATTSASQTFSDTGHVLDTGGYDRACIGNESLAWRQVGSVGIDNTTATLVLSGPASAAPGAPVTVTATVTDASHAPLPNVTVDFSVASGPDAGAHGAQASDVNGHASFTYTAGGLGTDAVKASVTTGGGTFGSNTVQVPINDVTAPSITATRSPAPNAFGWNNTAVTVTFTCADPDSAFTCPSPTTVSSEGMGQSVTGSATDPAGNMSSLTVSGINIDKTPPVTTASQKPAANANGWNNSNVTVSLSATDNLSGVAATQFNLDGAGWMAYAGPLTLSAEGVHSLLYRSTDKAGNTEAARTLTVRIDKTCPEAYLQWDPKSHDLLLFGRDSGSGVPGGAIAPTSVTYVDGDDDDNQGEKHAEKGDDDHFQLRTYTVTDLAGNSMGMVVKVHQQHDSLQARVVSITMCDGSVHKAMPNKIAMHWDTNDSSKLESLEQKVQLGHGESELEVNANWNDEKDTTHIRVESDDMHKDLHLAGMVLLRIATHKGDLSVEY